MTTPLITDEPAVLTWAIALARRGALPDAPPKRHWWRELVTTHWRDAHDQWERHAEAASNGWATELAEFRNENPPPTLKAFMVGLSAGRIEPGSAA